MALLDVSSWQTGNQKWVPIGKRIKNVVIHPDDFEMYYFKEPKEKYPWEFWNEIVASVIGKELGFNTLEYRPAVMDGIGGCLSKSMTENFSEELIHGQQYLIRMLPEFELKKGTDHTFQLIEEFFKSDSRARNMLDQFIEMLIFDAVVGNRDRHQQNWAIIRRITAIRTRTILYNALKELFSGNFKMKNFRNPYEIEVIFSPLFDNGNCLAYNIVENDIDNYLENQDKLEKYLFGSKAVSHVRWFGNSLPHIELLMQIEKKYPEIIKKTIKTIRKEYRLEKISKLVNDINKNVTFENEIYNLSQKRKDLMIRLIQIRTEKLLSSFEA
jgi:hypothetical protein